jgi:hypothetical protein
MVSTLHCQFCGQLITNGIPQLFGPSPQKVFAFIWNHPGSTMREIMYGVYGRETYTNAVSVYLTQIRRGLKGTEYHLESLVTSKLQKTQYRTKRPRQYFIKPSVRAEPTARTEGSDNVSL